MSLTQRPHGSDATEYKLEVQTDTIELETRFVMFHDSADQKAFEEMLGQAFVIIARGLAAQ